MKVSEKTLEINFCAQFPDVAGRTLIWFGLTQKQEARAGFDACTKFGGRIILFQFKASCHSVGTARRFHAPHQQMINLKNRCRVSRSVFYVFPMVGTTREFSRDPNIISQSWLLDVASIPNIGSPTTRSGSLRKNRRHYIDVTPPNALIHSDPVEVKVFEASHFATEGIHYAEGIGGLFGNSFDEFWGYCKLFRRTAAGLVIINAV